MDSIKEIKRWASDVACAWNGDESGKEADMAVIANKILDIIEDLQHYRRSPSHSSIFTIDIIEDLQFWICLYYVAQLDYLDSGDGPIEDEDRGYEQGS